VKTQFDILQGKKPTNKNSPASTEPRTDNLELFEEYNAWFLL
jgi:hypothetical protein